MERVVLVDGHNLLFKMYYGIPNSILNSKGDEIKGLVGFIGSLKKLVDMFRPYCMVVVFDSESSRNSNLDVDYMYKANRIDYGCDEDNPFTQLSYIYKALDYLGIPYVEVCDNEADDYIASFIMNNKGYLYTIVSTDTDFFQLVDRDVSVYVMNGKRSVLYDEMCVFDRYGVMPSCFVLYKALVGDKSDNIDGIRGIGKVYASRIARFNDIDLYINSGACFRLSKMLDDNRDLIRRNILLITLNRSIDTLSVSKLGSKIYEKKTYEVIFDIGLK